MEPVMGIEPATCCLRNSCSATELHRPGCGKYGAATAIILAYGRAWGTPDGTYIRSIYRRGYYGFFNISRSGRAIARGGIPDHPKAVGSPILLQLLIPDFCYLPAS